MDRVDHGVEKKNPLRIRERVCCEPSAVTVYPAVHEERLIVLSMVLSVVVLRLVLTAVLRLVLPAVLFSCAARQ